MILHSEVSTQNIVPVVPFRTSPPSRVSWFFCSEKTRTFSHFTRTCRLIKCWNLIKNPPSLFHPNKCLCTELQRTNVSWSQICAHKSSLVVPVGHFEGEEGKNNNKLFTLPVTSKQIPSSRPSFPLTAYGVRTVIDAVDEFVSGAKRSSTAEGWNVWVRRERHAGGWGGALCPPPTPLL